MRIVFVYPDFERHARSNPELLETVPAKEYFGSPSMGIANLAALTPSGMDIAFVDDRLTPFDPDMEGDLFALSVFTPAATRGLEIGDALRARGKRVVMGGIFPSVLPEECALHADAVVVGEGEPVWLQILEDAKRGSLQSRYQADAPFDLDRMPFPRIDLYLEGCGDRADDFPVQHSRGCPFACHACVVPGVMGRIIRHIPDDLVLRVLRALGEAHRLCSFTEDSALLFAQGAQWRFRRLMRRIIREKQEGAPYRFSYIGVSMPVLLSLKEEVLQEMKAAGIHRVYLVCGFDAVSQNAMGRGLPVAVEKAHLSVKRCQDHGILPYISFLAGNPTDDNGVFDRCLEFAEKAKLDIAEFVIATPYPGTPLWHQLLNEGRIFDRTWKHYNDANVVFKPHNMTVDELHDGYLRMWREFYSCRPEVAHEPDVIRNRVQF